MGIDVEGCRETKRKASERDSLFEDAVTTTSALVLHKHEKIWVLCIEFSLIIYFPPFSSVNPLLFCFSVFMINLHLFIA